MASPAFTKFDPRAFLECETWKAAALMHAKAAEAPVRSAEHRPTLAGLATLAGQQVKIENRTNRRRDFPTRKMNKPPLSSLMPMSRMLGPRR
jgi:hypothetical protein